MNHSKKALALILTSALCLGLAVPAFAAGTPADSAPTAWYTEAMQFVSDNGLMAQPSDGALDPDAAVTDTVFLGGLQVLDPAQDAGGAGAPLTREQAVAALYKLAAGVGLDVSMGEDTNILSYDDAADITEGYAKAFRWACGVGLVNGTGEGKLDPKGTLTNAQAATLLMRCCKLLESALADETDGEDKNEDEDDGSLKKISAEEKERMRALYGENKEITDGNYDESLAVKCVNGTFVGKKTENVIAYKGIPYVAKQPVEELRWKAPLEYAPDDGVYEAYYNGKTPWQIEGSDEKASLYVQGEDCLYLNIWKSDEASEGKKPVMVWIHGGANETGGTVDPLYECHNLVKENPDVIVVSVGYRIGVYGFLHLSHLPDGQDYPDAQNLGLMDQMMALKWVHENIEAFGGDPEDVTLFGESSGAGSVTLLPLVDGAQEYFHRVIAQSGSPFFSRSTESAIDTTNEIMEMVGCKTVADLQKVDPEKFVEEASSLILKVWPERDGNYLPLDPFAAYANGAAKDISILQGCNKDEMGYFIVLYGLNNFNAFSAVRVAEVLNKLPEGSEELVESFLNDAKDVSPEYTPLTRLMDQVTFIAPLFLMAENQTKNGGTAYNYFFTVESTVPMMQSGHAVELASVFNRPEETGFTGRAFDATFSSIMRKMWVQFAKTGDPSLSADISPDGKAHEWPVYDLKSKQMMVFDEFNIHPEKEAERKIVDWDRTYFITQYYIG